MGTLKNSASRPSASRRYSVASWPVASQVRVTLWPGLISCGETLNDTIEIGTAVAPAGTVAVAGGSGVAAGSVAVGVSLDVAEGTGVGEGRVGLGAGVAVSNGMGVWLGVLVWMLMTDAG